MSKYLKIEASDCLVHSFQTKLSNGTYDHMCNMSLTHLHMATYWTIHCQTINMELRSTQRAAMLQAQLELFVSSLWLVIQPLKFGFKDLQGN